MAVLLPRHCSHCGRRDNLLRCAGCQIVYYCSREHQTKSWKAHKTDCNLIRAEHRKFLQEESLWLDIVEAADPAWVREQCAGRYWQIPTARNYLQSRLSYSSVLLHPNTIDGVERAVEHQMDVLQLGHSDEARVRRFMPHLLLRLGRDQEAYDFVKWWATEGQKVKLMNNSEPRPNRAKYMNCKGENAFEEVGGGLFTAELGSLSRKLVVALVKIRLWMDLRDVCNADRALRGALSHELVDLIKARVVRSDVVTGRPDLINHPDRAVLKMAALQKQIRTMMASIRQGNEFMLPYLFFPNPKLFWEDDTVACTKGSREEAQMMLADCHLAWAETPGAIDVGKKALAAVQAAS